MISEQAKQAKRESILNKVFRFNEGIMSRRDWLKLMLTKDCYTKIGERSIVEYNRIKYNRMDAKQQEEYDKKLDTKVIDYRLYSKEGSFWSITQTEFEYFNSL